MATTQTTTLRVPTRLRDDIAALAEERGTSMLDVVAHAIHRLKQEQWWDDVAVAIDGMDAAEKAAYRVEAQALDGVASDGLDER